ncbi:hypothetical protein [Streptomyces sp. TE33382]
MAAPVRAVPGIGPGRRRVGPAYIGSVRRPRTYTDGEAAAAPDARPDQEAGK